MIVTVNQGGMSPLIVKITNAERNSSLSAAGSRYEPNSVRCRHRLAINPSSISVTLATKRTAIAFKIFSRARKYKNRGTRRILSIVSILGRFRKFLLLILFNLRKFNKNPVGALGVEKCHLHWWKFVNNLHSLTLKLIAGLINILHL